MNLDNYIEGIYRDMQSSLKEDYVDLYSFFDDERLQYIFSTIHTDMMAELKSMNTRLPTREYEAHFWADSSRILLSAIELLEDLFRKLKKTKYEFIIDEYYEAVIKKCNTFLSPRYGSTIPAHMDKIELYYTIPIIKQLNVINIENPDIQNTATLKLIGEGSYAHVYTYVDQFYNKQYVVKRAKKNLTEKEIQRFKQEYEELKQLSSPYIVEVYRYNDDKKEYIMEYGELYFLKNYMLKKYDVKTAICSWSGPNSTSKDFSLSDNWFEIKTIGNNVQNIHISSLTQLSSSIDGRLVVIKIEEMSDKFNNDDSNISVLLKQIIEQLNDEKYEELFLSKISNFCLQDDYISRNYDVKSMNIYLVNNKFPRLTEKDISYPEISEVKYTLLVNSLEQYKE